MKKILQILHKKKILQKSRKMCHIIISSNLLVLHKMSKLCKYLLFTSNEIESSTIEPPF